MIPPLDDRGLLPPGVHQTTGWDELRTRFAINPHRQQLLNNLLGFVKEFLIPGAQGLDFYVAGSFLSDKPQPDDIDCTVNLEFDEINQRAPLLAIATLGNKGPLYEERKVEFYLNLMFQGAETGNFIVYFQYVGEKTAGAKGLSSTDLRGIVKVKSWNQL